jgi:hypothetical protein
MRIVINSRKPATTAGSPPAAAGLPALALAQAGRHTAIAPANLQAVLDSAANAVHKGQAAYWTPTAWAEALALPLPAYRPAMVDLTCGNGQLLAGAAAPGTFHRLGCDIEALPDDPEQLMGASFPARFIQADVTLLANYLHRANWMADCFVLNFPFDHHWYRERLAFLGDSNCRAVEMAFSKHDGRTSEDTIDSTIAGLCLALDRCSPWGEGYIIANHNTVNRLLWNDDAPHAALAAHIWCRVTVNHNICDGREGMLTDILYFARSHTSGCNKEIHSITSLAEAAQQLAVVGKSRLGLRAGSVVRQYEGGHTASTAELWDAIGLEWRTDQGKNRPTDQRWNIWLDTDGTLATNLTPFQEAAEPLKKEQYVRLHALKGKHPMQLILQKAERKDLERAVFGTIWRVAPAVIEAVQGALAEYNAVRSPLYPLSQIQRLGYLDDNDDILCLKDLWLVDGVTSLGGTPMPPGEPTFKAGQRYTIRTETISVTRLGQKMNVTGSLDDVSWEGSELALFIRDGEGIERLFMEGHLAQSNVRLSIQAEGAPSPIEFNLQHLIEHFEIPEVPDVAAVHPEAYQHNLALLHLIEEIVNSANQN